MPDEKNLRERAYTIWEQDGRPDGRHADHWNRAHDELSQDVVDQLGEGTIEPDGQPAAGPAVEETRDEGKSPSGNRGQQRK